MVAIGGHYSNWLGVASVEVDNWVGLIVGLVDIAAEMEDNLLEIGHVNHTKTKV
jgi:hypothetical protein